MSCSPGLEVTGPWLGPPSAGRQEAGAGSPPCKGSRGPFLRAVSAASTAGITGQGVMGLVAPRWAGAHPHQGQRRLCPGPVCPLCPSSGRPLALRVWWSFLPPPPAPTTVSFPQTPARRGPTTVPTRLPLLPPLGCRGSSPSGRWGLEVGVPGSSPLQGFGSGEVPRQGTELQCLGARTLALRTCPCWVLACCGVFLTPLCPLPSWAPPFLTPSCPSLRPRATPAPWDPSRPVLGLAALPALGSLLI